MSIKKILTGQRAFLLGLFISVSIGSFAIASRFRDLNNESQTIGDVEKDFAVFEGGSFATSSDTANIEIKDTNYPIPKGAYFVSPNGKDINSGKSPSSPWPVALALKSAPSGATLVFRGGTYRDVHTGINKKLTLQAYPQEKAWLKGSIEVNGWIKDGGIWRKDAWSYSFPPDVGSEYIDPKYPMAGYRDMVYINGVSLKQVASKAQVVPGTFYLDTANKRLYIGDNPVGKTVEATALKQAFHVKKGGSSTIIRGLGFAHYADLGVGVQAQKVTLENNTFVWNGVTGARINGTDAQLVGNTFSYNGRKGLGGDKAHRLLLDSNTISYNNVERFDTTWDAAGVKFLKTRGLSLRQNIVEHNQANGIWLDISCTFATIVNNSSRYNKGMGIFFELSHQVIIASNLVYKNVVGIMLSDSSNARVYNNTLSMNNKHIVVKDTKRENTNAAEIAAGNRWISRDNVLKNNIFSNAKGSTLFDASDCTNKQQSEEMIAAADYNAYYRKVSTKPKNVIKWSAGKGKCSAGYGNLAAFKSATSGYETNAIAVDNVAPNPFFVDEASGDYRLKPGSPARGVGAALPEDIASAIGLPPGARVDLGALQP